MAKPTSIYHDNGVVVMTQFHEGQEVEVVCGVSSNGTPIWRKAKIVNLPHAPKSLDDGRKYTVQFYGISAVFNEADIRPDTTLRVSSNDPMGTRAMTKEEARDFKAALAEAHDEALQAEGKP